SPLLLLLYEETFLLSTIAGECQIFLDRIRSDAESNNLVYRGALNSILYVWYEHEPTEVNAWVNKTINDDQSAIYIFMNFVGKTTKIGGNKSNSYTRYEFGYERLTKYIEKDLIVQRAKEILPKLDSSEINIEGELREFAMITLETILK
ncbi:MAG: hypothetical protein AAFQ07_14085, partial [Chloroflexota bacterium]